ncbi:ABC transporter ATP-binding protein [Mucilaginibacter sp. AW1-3]
MLTPSFLDAVSVTKSYSNDKKSGVNNITLSIKQGKITAIVGESGSGKSTLLKLLYGLLSPLQGEVLFKSERIIGPEEKLIPGHDRMKMVTQHTDDLNLFATVWQNVSALLPNTDLKYKETQTEKALKQMKVWDLRDQRIIDLSGGEKQRVAIAKALITNPEVLFLDEPFNQVDASFREGLQQNIRTIVKDTGLTVVLVSHDPAEVLSMADDLVVIRQGEIVEAGTPEELYQTPGMLYTAQILSNCSVLTKEQAKVCGIETEHDTVAINPENIEIVNSWGKKKDWTVTQVLFKGFFEELIIEKADTKLRVLNLERDKYPVGTPLSIRIKQHLEYGQWK